MRSRCINEYNTYSILWSLLIHAVCGWSLKAIKHVTTALIFNFNKQLCLQSFSSNTVMACGTETNHQPGPKVLLQMPQNNADNFEGGGGKGTLCTQSVADRYRPNSDIYMPVLERWMKQIAPLRLWFEENDADSFCTTMSQLILQLQWNTFWQTAGWWMPADCFYSLNWKLPYKKEDSRMLRMSTRTHLFCATLRQAIKDTLQSREIILKENKRNFLSLHAICASYRLGPGTLQLDSVTPQHSDIYHIRLAYWMECPTALSLRRTAHINLHSRQQH